jgi:glucosamine--fructose-6-phosphate aminotransferase (isomerizing)
MCGIVGYVGTHRAVPIILEGLKRLEYRGYDSAGIAVYGDDKQFTIRRAKGKLRNLEDAIRLSPVEGSFGIGHTRWATHGRPTEENAHPHRDCHGDVVVVHNGIIENYLELKHRLQAEGHTFTTETDTEVVAHLVESHLNGNLEEAVRKAVKELTGSFALAVISRSDPQKIVAARYQAPLVVGTGDNEYFVASDVPAILTHTQDMIFLADGDMAVLTPEGVLLSDFDANASTFCGTRFWRKRAATSISCSRRFSSSRAPSATPHWDAWDRKQAAFSWTKWISRRPNSRASRRSELSPAGPVGTPGWRANS